MTASPEAPRPAITAGYKLVPIEPTEEQIEAMHRVIEKPYNSSNKAKRYQARHAYKAMLAASPEAPQPAKPAEQEPFTVLVRKHSWLPGQWEAAPCGFPDYGKQWADERINVYTAPQTAKQEPLSYEELVVIGKQQDPAVVLHHNVRAFARAIEAAHGIGSLGGSGMANTAAYTPDTDAEPDLVNLLKSAKKLLKELDVLREAEIDKEDWMPVNEADEALVAAIAKVEGRS